MIFLDSGFILAYVNKDDPHHPEVLSLMNKILEGEFGRIVVSDFIIDEVLTPSRVRTKTCQCAKSIMDLISLKKKNIFFKVFTDDVILERTTNKFTKLCSKGFSFTDCSTLIIMKIYSIKNLTSFDSYFKGLVSILP